MNNCFHLVFNCLLGLALVTGITSSLAADGHTNLLLVICDEMRGDDMRHAGNDDVRTPYLDRLAAEGVAFSRAYANCPVCTPSRASLLTGVHAVHHQAISNDIPIRTDLPTLGTTLSEAGYANGFIGKWHMDGIPRSRFTPPGPRRLGFNSFWAVYNCHHEYYNGRYYSNAPKIVKIDGYEPVGQTTLAIEFMERHRKDPFSMVLSWGPPHGPLDQVPDHYKQLYDPAKIKLRPNVKPDQIGRWALACAIDPLHPTEQVKTRYDGDIEQRIRESIACYYAHITALDDQIGRLLDALTRLQLDQNTIVVFTADHGSMHWSHGRIRKQQPWEESIRIPMLIRAPGKLPAGKVSDKLIGIVDLAPTLLDLMGQQVPEQMTGRRLAAAVRGEQPAPTSLLLGVPVPVDGVTEEGVERAWRGIRTPRHTYARWQDGSSWVLYDNEADPYQLQNLVNDPNAAALRDRLEAELEKALERDRDPFLPWQEHLRRAGMIEQWNRREGPQSPRRIET